MMIGEATMRMKGGEERNHQQHGHFILSEVIQRERVK